MKVLDEILQQAIDSKDWQGADIIYPELQSALQELQIYRAVMPEVIEALEYYSHPDHYEENIKMSGIRPPGILTEAGDKARAVLESWKRFKDESEK